MFNTTSQYALRALAWMARETAGTSVLGQDLAERTQIPANYLAKILWTLRNAGYLEATRGHGGGYRLARAADEITLVEVVRLFEGVSAEPGCLLGEQHECSDKNACSAHEAWKKVKEAYLQFIRNTTIAEIGASDEPAAGRPKKPRRTTRKRTVAARKR
jgi:Rrf2 family protein